MNITATLRPSERPVYDDEFKILQTALGMHTRRPGYRNRYFATLSGPQFDRCERLIDLGYLELISSHPNDNQPMNGYAVTPAGCALLDLTPGQTAKAREGLD